VVLMTNGPNAVLAEIVENPLPKERQRNAVHRHPLYYGVRNHIIDFLVSRSRSFADEMKGTNYDRRRVPVVRPGAPQVAAARPAPLDSADAGQVRGPVVPDVPAPSRPGLVQQRA